MKLGYLGPEGSFSHAAAIAYAAPGVLKIGLKTFYEIIREVEKESIDQGILPIENSTEGAVTPVMDALMDTSISGIQGEVILKIEHCLLSVGDKIENIKYVLSHHQALEQCREFFKNNCPNITLISSESTSGACITAKEGGKNYGAIANSLAGNIYNMNVLYDCIQDNFFNQTRFIVIGRDKPAPTGNDKTSIAFSFHDDYPGSLFSVLKEFAEEKINLTRIESRPAKTELGKYVFYIDFSGHMEDEKVRKVLEKMKKITRKIKIFGSYPAGKMYQNND